jgi:tetratricopeptide (TPR) repeat protein
MGNRFFFIFLFLAVNLSAQTSKIDSLKKVLPGLSDHEKVICFNALAHEYNFNFIQSDSALHYANLAFEYGLAVNDNVGKAVSLLTQADVQGRLLGNMALMERKSKLAIEYLQNKKDPLVLSLAYYKLAIAYHNEGKDELAFNAAFKAKEISNAVNDKHGFGWALEAIGLIYCHKGEYWKSFENLIESQRIGKEINDSLLTAVSLAFIGRCFNRVGDPQKALDYYHQFLQYATPFVLLWPHIEDMAFAQLQLKQYDSVTYYQQKHRKNLAALVGDPLVQKRFNTFFWGYSVEVQLAHEQYDAIISDVKPQLGYLREKGDVFPLMQSLLVLGNAYQAKGKFNSAMKFARELLALARKTSISIYERDASKLMASLFDQTTQHDSAYLYYKNYIAIKDAMDTTQFAQRTALYLAASEAERRISLLERDRTIKVQQLVLNKKELLKQGQLKNTLAASLIVLFLLSFLVLRNIILKRKNEKLRHDQVQLALKRKALELEMQALRAQMNPHFIFNCLSAIDNLMQTNQPDKATSYLARFANLIRNVLECSKNNLVPFQKILTP